MAPTSMAVARFSVLPSLTSVATSKLLPTLTIVPSLAAKRTFQVGPTSLNMPNAFGLLNCTTSSIPKVVCSSATGSSPMVSTWSTATVVCAAVKPPFFFSGPERLMKPEENYLLSENVAQLVNDVEKSSVVNHMKLMLQLQVLLEKMCIQLVCEDFLALHIWITPKPNIVLSSLDAIRSVLLPAWSDGDIDCKLDAAAMHFELLCCQSLALFILPEAWDSAAAE